MDETEQESIKFKADVQLSWLLRDGAEPGKASLLVDAVRAVATPPVGTRIQGMAGTEYTASKAIRCYWRDKLKLDEKDVLPVAYWRNRRAEGEVTSEGEEN